MADEEKSEPATRTRRASTSESLSSSDSLSSISTRSAVWPGLNWRHPRIVAKKSGFVWWCGAGWLRRHGQAHILSLSLASSFALSLTLALSA